MFVVHADLPMPDRDAMSGRLFAMVEALAHDGHEVTFLGRGAGLQPPRYRHALEQLGVVTYVCDAQRLTECGFQAPGESIDLAEVLTREQPDVALLIDHEIANQYRPHIQRHAPRCRIVVDASDVHHVRLQRGAQLSGDPAEQAQAHAARAGEELAWRHADAVISISADDAQHVHALAPGVPTTVVPVVADPRGEGLPREQRSGVLFVGNFRHQPNVDGVRWLVEECWPRVRHVLPGVTLTLAGTDPPPEVLALSAPDVIVTGFVPDLTPLLDGSLVSVAPLRYGAGVKGKIAEAMSAGLPVVTTTVGNEGMDLTDGEHALIADAPADLATAITRLHHDARTWERLAANGRRWVAAHTSRVQVREAMRTALQTAPPIQRARAAVVAQLHRDLDPARAQLQALAQATRPPGCELVITADGWTVREAEELRRIAPADAVVITGPEPVGARGTLARAVNATTAQTLVVLGPLALAPAGPALGTLLARAEGTTALHGAVVDGAHGYDIARDGSLWPRDADTPGRADTLALDCIAADRATLSALPGELPARDGLREAQLARHVAIVVHDDVHVSRIPAPPISAIVCTRNRADELVDCVALLARSNVAEVVLVDNASTDDTPQTVKALQAEYPHLVKAVHEPQQGLCHARNAGLAAATHPGVCYIDDDARPGPGWATAIGLALEAPGVTAAGGPIAGLWPDGAERPPKGLERLFSVLEGGDKTRRVTPPDFVYGANWAARRTAVTTVGGFDPTFGLGPTQRINADETTVAWRLHKNGIGHTRFVPEAAVGHRIDPGRLNWTWMFERSWLVGVERARQDVVLHQRRHEELIDTATQIAAHLVNLLPPGDRDPATTLTQIAEAPALDAHTRIVLADYFGWLVGWAALLGEDAIEAGAIRVAVGPEHADGWLHGRPSMAAATGR